MIPFQSNIRMHLLESVDSKQIITAKSGDGDFTINFEMMSYLPSRYGEEDSVHIRSSRN